VVFLLFCILLCLCPPLRRLLGALFWILVIVVAWHWPSDERPASAPAVTPAAVIDELPVPYGARRDVLPGVDFPAPFVGPRQPRPYRQN
jgi:hypothetical protein